MGWLFGKKKVPKVPFPEGRFMEEGALRLPGRLSGERVIEPDEIKAAAGIDYQEKEFPSEEMGMPQLMPKPSMPPTNTRSAPFFLDRPKSAPLFVKVELYQRLLAELDGAKTTISSMYEINRQLDASEYNEENNFVKLRRSIKNMHDTLLLIDKIVFKAEGE